MLGGILRGWNFRWVEFSWVEFSWVEFSWLEFSWVEFSWNRCFCLLWSTSPSGKIEAKQNFAFSWILLFLFSMRVLRIAIYGECYQNVLEVTIVTKEIECADRIVYETGIYKAVVVTIRASECIFYLYKWKDCSC